jgi:hypothetical protein
MKKELETLDTQGIPSSKIQNGKILFFYRKGGKRGYPLRIAPLLFLLRPLNPLQQLPTKKFDTKQG